MNLFKEPILYNDPLLRIQVLSFNSMKICQDGWHFHPQVEIVAVRSGRMEIHTPAEVYHLRMGDVLILGSCQPHLDLRKPNEVVDYIVLQFELESFFDSNMLPYLYLFQESMLPLVELNTLFKENPELRQQFYSTVIELQREHQLMQRGYEIAINFLVKKCIFLLLRHDNKGLLGPSFQTDHGHFLHRLCNSTQNQICRTSAFDRRSQRCSDCRTGRLAKHVPLLQTV